MGDEQIEVSVVIVIDKSTACAPTRGIAGYVGLAAYFGEGAVSIVVIENILAPIRNKEVVEAIVIVVTYADALSPSRARQSCFCGDIGKGAVPIVFE